VRCLFEKLGDFKENSGQKVFRWLGMVEHACNPSYSGERGSRIMNLRLGEAKFGRPYLKKKGLGPWLRQ
jgi:hypothetical protein